jgi:hypothetical protein
LNRCLRPVTRTQVEDLGADGAYETLSEGVGLRGTHRGLQHPSPFGSKHLVEGCRVLGVAVPDEEADAIELIGHPEVARLLGHPCRIRLRVTPSMWMRRDPTSMKNKT